MKPLWGIDLGGTKIEGVVLPDQNSTKPICRLRVPTGAANGYDHMISQISALIEEMSQVTGLKPNCLGMGTPGTLDPALGVMKNSNTTALNGRRFKDDLEASIGIEVRLANDANCFALAEATLGSAKGYPTVFGVIMGTGVGGGLVVDGKVLNGGQGIAGEWGHNLLDPNGVQCYCGKIGCVETVISGPSIERHYTSLTGIHLSLKEIVVQDCQATDATLEYAMQSFGKALSVVVNIFDPHAIVLGGGVGNLDILYTRGVEELVKHVFNNGLTTVILRPTLGDSAGVFGAAMLTV